MYIDINECKDLIIQKMELKLWISVNPLMKKRKHKELARSL